MDDETRRALDALARAAEKGRRLLAQPVTLSPEYLEHIRRVEALPQNQSGADKTWVERCRKDFREHFAKARLVR